MTYIRLTNEKRTNIERQFITAVLKEREENLRAERDAMVSNIYRRLLGEAYQLVQQAPSGFFVETTRLRVSIDGDRIDDPYFAKYGLLWGLHHSSPLRMPHEWLHNEQPLTDPGDKHLVTTYIGKSLELHRVRKELEAQIQALLRSCTTVNKLLELMPTIVEFVPDINKELPKQLPAVNVDGLLAKIEEVRKAA